MSDTYSTHATICAKFYQLTLDSRAVGEFVFRKTTAVAGEKVLFVGGMFDVAATLSTFGLQVTLVDYTDAMVALGKQRLPNCEILKADLRSLPFQGEFDAVFVAGRVFTHMITDEDLTAALGSCHRALKPSGKLFADNYEDSRIQVTNYFNGRIEARDDTCSIVRTSTTELISSTPCVVDWRAEYSGVLDGTEFRFFDSIDHRAFSRAEFAEHLAGQGFSVLDQGDNFDETSFYTISQRSIK